VIFDGLRVYETSTQFQPRVAHVCGTYASICRAGKYSAFSSPLMGHFIVILSTVSLHWNCAKNI